MLVDPVEDIASEGPHLVEGESRLRSVWQSRSIGRPGAAYLLLNCVTTSKRG